MAMDVGTIGRVQGEMATPIKTANPGGQGRSISTATSGVRLCSPSAVPIGIHLDDLIDIRFRHIAIGVDVGILAGHSQGFLLLIFPGHGG